MIEAAHYSPAGARHQSPFALPADYFDGTVHEHVLHQAVRALLNNQRQGTPQTKSRSFVSGGNQKPWKQKGTGRARQGSTRAPHWRGGGIVFGPHPRDYTTDIPRKVKQLARQSALNARARESGLHVIERLAFRVPKIKQMAELLAKLGVEDRKVLVLTAAHNPNAYLSGRNLPRVQVMRYSDAAAYDILWADAVVVEEGAITGVVPEGDVAEPEPAPAPAAKPRPRKAVKQAAAPAKKKAPKKKAAPKAKAATKVRAKKSSARGGAKKPAPKKKGD